ncbi:MAG: DedA family protein [Actinomycetota bacterium]|nr:DedA family protein [Actinomycetota bacterium]
MSIQGIVDSGGYPAVFGLVMVESFGVPIPGETALIAAATYAGATHRLSIWVIFVVASAAAALGDATGYFIGSKGGYRLLRRWGHYVRFDESRIKVARYLFSRHGGKVVFFGRFISILRTYAAFLAGVALMRFRRFLVFNVAGGILWAAFYSFAAYFAGSTLARVTTPVDIAFGAAAVIAIVAAAIVVHRRLGALTEVAEAAFPGPLEP